LQGPTRGMETSPRVYTTWAIGIKTKTRKGRREGAQGGVRGSEEKDIRAQGEMPCETEVS